MKELVEILNQIPDGFKSSAVLILITILTVERIYSLISKGQQDWLARRKSSHQEMEHFIKSDERLQPLVDEIKSSDAFYQLSNLKVDSERRLALLDMYKNGYISRLQMKKINQFLIIEENGMFNLQLGLSEFWSAFSGLVLIYFIGMALLTLNFCISTNDRHQMPLIFLIGSIFIFLVALMTRGDVSKIRAVLDVSKKMEEKGVFVGRATLRGQFSNAIIINKKSLFYSSTFALISLIISYGASLVIR